MPLQGQYPHLFHVESCDAGPSSTILMLRSRQGIHKYIYIHNWTDLRLVINACERQWQHEQGAALQINSLVLSALDYVMQPLSKSISLTWYHHQILWKAQAHGRMHSFEPAPSDPSRTEMFQLCKFTTGIQSNI